MDDTGYEATRHARALQARRLVDTLNRHTPESGGRRLLDVGAGSGILLEAATAQGWQAEGVEPSRWLAQEAAHRGLRVHLGVLPCSAAAGPYDAVTVVDVIEHVPDPVGLMRDVRKVLDPGGIALVVTPDVQSIAARLMKWKWWHYRVAHIGYFDRVTLERCMRAAGLECVAWARPSWYFTRRLSRRAGHGLRSHCAPSHAALIPRTGYGAAEPIRQSPRAGAPRASGGGLGPADVA